MAHTADAVVIGGGVMGASGAFHLACRGFGHVQVLERDTLCAGSTGRSVASVDLLAQQPSVAALQVRSLHAFQHARELYGDECGWVQTGMALLAGAESADGVRDVVRVMSAAGGRVTGVRTPARSIAAGTVVVAAGPWTADFLRPAGIELSLRPNRHAVAL